MALQDTRLILFDDLSIAGVATTDTLGDNVWKIDGSQKFFSRAAGGDPIHITTGVNDLAKAGRLALVVEVGSEELLASGGTATIDFKLWEHTAAEVKSGTAILSINVPGVTQTTAAAHVTVGKRLFTLIVPPDLWGDTTNMYIGLSAYINTQTLSTGKINAWLDQI